MLMDMWCQAHNRGDFDPGGASASRGQVHQRRLDEMLAHPFVASPLPKSLDRHDFDLQAVEGLSFEDGLATLARFSALSIGVALRACPSRPTKLIGVGGGVHNGHLLGEIEQVTDLRVMPATDGGWSADQLEAELMAYCAVRCAYELPITFPGTTGAPEPLTGGTCYKSAVA